MDQAHIAAVVGVSRTTVSGWEQGRFEPTFSQILRWAHATGQSLDWFADPLSAVDVRPKGLEPPTFWMGVSWTSEDDAAVAALLNPTAGV